MTEERCPSKSGSAARSDDQPRGDLHGHRSRRENRRRQRAGRLRRRYPLLSYYAISANGQRWLRLTSASLVLRARIHLTNPPSRPRTATCPRHPGPRHRAGGRGGHPRGSRRHEPRARPVRFNLEIALRSDFADLFEVRQHKFVRRGPDHRRELGRGARTSSRRRYANRDFHCEPVFRRSQQRLAAPLRERPHHFESCSTRARAGTPAAH